MIQINPVLQNHGAHELLTAVRHRTAQAQPTGEPLAQARSAARLKARTAD
jgi:hypothetical protein